MTLRIHRQIDSATLTLPELQPLIGKTVEIIVRESKSLTSSRGTGDWTAMQTAADHLEGYDFEAWRRQRGLDQQHAANILP
jgi:hypothetical protein